MTYKNIAQAEQQTMATAKLAELLKRRTPGLWLPLDLRMVGKQAISIAYTTSEGKLGGIVARVQNAVSGAPLDESDVANSTLMALAPALAKEVLELRAKLGISK